MTINFRFVIISLKLRGIMMEINRNYYLQKLIDHKFNGMVKIVTGVRRCGKSYLLFNLFYRHLIDEGICENHIIKVSPDRRLFKTAAVVCCEKARRGATRFPDPHD